MKLFQTYDSPFPTRVRLLLMAKGLDVEIIQPPGFHGDGLTKEEYLKVNPIGRVPALVLDDGRALPESEVICEYLEDAYPEPSLRPADPFERARMRLLSRICDFYLVMAMVPLFDYSARSRRSWDREGIAKAMGKMTDALAYLEQFIGTEGYAVGKALTQADGAIIPQLILTCEWAPKTFEVDDPLPAFPKLSAYWAAVQTDPLARRLAQETRDAIVESQERARAWAAARR
jgi:glutathione S-transferase